MKYYGEQDVICPFYAGEDKQNIYCEGLTDQTEMVCRFCAPNNKKSYQLKYCNSYDYQKCKYAQLLELIKYQEEEKMPKTTKEKLESATALIKELKIEQQSFERERKALTHQIEWRQAEIDKQKAKVDATEMLTKYLAHQLVGEKELRVPITSLAEYSTNYDVIAVQDKETNEIVITLYDKKTKEIKNNNFLEYQKDIEVKVKKYGPGNLYGDYVVVGKQYSEEETNKAIKKAKAVLLERRNKIQFPKNIAKKLRHSTVVFDKHEGSIIVAWYAVVGK